MKELNKIMLYQAAIMNALAILLVPGAEASQAPERLAAARELNRISAEIQREVMSLGQ